MSGRHLGPLWLDEFTAGHLQDLLHDELESLREQLHEQRDKAHRLDWARMKLRIQGLHEFHNSIASYLREPGEPPDDVVESFKAEVQRWSHEMPRSKANATAWKAQKAEERERRAKFLRDR